MKIILILKSPFYAKFLKNYEKINQKNTPNSTHYNIILVYLFIVKHSFNRYISIIIDQII